MSGQPISGNDDGLSDLLESTGSTEVPAMPELIVYPTPKKAPIVAPPPAPAPVQPPAQAVPTPPLAEPIPAPVAATPAEPVSAPTPAPEPVVVDATPAPEPVVEIPLIPVPEPIAATAAAPIANSDTTKHMQNVQMGNKLTTAIEEGKHKVPEVPAPLIAKPSQLEPWRVFKIMSEFVEGFDFISKYQKGATFFGSQRSSFDPAIYQAATDLASRLAKAGFAIVTGGSDGIMEAANKGAFEAGGASLGLNIRLDDNQETNKYVTASMMFDHFFVRKVMLAFASEVYIYFPGGFGTLDEFTEILTLVQTKKIRPVPIVLYGKEYWTPLLDLFKNDLDAKYHAISAGDEDLYHLVDSVDEAYDYIIKNVPA